MAISAESHMPACEAPTSTTFRVAEEGPNVHGIGSLTIAGETLGLQVSGSWPNPTKRQAAFDSTSLIVGWIEPTELLRLAPEICDASEVADKTAGVAAPAVEARDDVMPISVSPIASAMAESSVGMRLGTRRNFAE